MYYCAKPRAAPLSPKQESKILFVYNHDDTLDQPSSGKKVQTVSSPRQKQNVYTQLIKRGAVKHTKYSKPSSKNKPPQEPVPVFTPAKAKSPRWNNPRINSVVELGLVQQLHNQQPTLHKPSSMELLAIAKSPSFAKNTPPLFPLNNKVLAKKDNCRYQDKTFLIQQTEHIQPPKGKAHGSSMLGQGYEDLKKEITRVGSNSSYKEKYRLKKHFQKVVHK